jgi:recombination protein RecT
MSSTAVATRTQGGAVAKATPIATLRALLEQMKDQFAAALPEHLKVDRLLRVAITAAQNTPKLLDCDQKSFLSAIMTCAQLGLEPDGVLGQAYLVPFNGKVQFIPGYRGLITLARNSGEVESLIAREVHENDIFGHWNERTQTYELNMADPLPPYHGIKRGVERGAVEYFYSVARFMNGGCQWEVMTLADVHMIRNRSAGWQSAVKFNKTDKSPWFTDEIEMGKKTVIRRISKYLPMSVQRAVRIEDQHDRGGHAVIDAAGDLLALDPAEDDAIAGAERRAIEATSSTLDRFEQEHVNPETGEVTQQPLV